MNTVTVDHLESYNPQNLANIIWAYATAGEQHAGLFKRIGDHVTSDNLKSYNSQTLANILWAYATAGVQHAALFKRVGDHLLPTT